MSLILMVAALAAPQTPETTQAKPEGERRICRKIINTGSLVAGKRECRTKAEWDLLASAARRNGEDIVQRNAGGIINQ